MYARFSLHTRFSVHTRSLLLSTPVGGTFVMADSSVVVETIEFIEVSTTSSSDEGLTTKPTKSIKKRGEQRRARAKKTWSYSRPPDPRKGERLRTVKGRRTWYCRTCSSFSVVSTNAARHHMTTIHGVQTKEDILEVCRVEALVWVAAAYTYLIRYCGGYTAKKRVETLWLVVSTEKGSATASLDIRTTIHPRFGETCV